MSKSRLQLFGAAVLLACLSLAPYAGTLDYGYVSIDDPYTIVSHQLLRELSWDTLPRFFEVAQRPGVIEYMPLKDVSYGIDMAAIGTDAPSLRPQQLFWYALCVLLFWLWIRRLDVAGRGEIAWFTALLFGLHPAHVESVTWLSGRKDLLSGAFMLAALWVAADPRPRRGFRVLGLQVLALLSKPMAVVTPGLVALQDLVGSPRTAWRGVLAKRWPLYAGLLSIVGLFAVGYVKLVGTTDPFIGQSEAHRIFQGPAALRWGQQLAGFAWLSVQPGALAPTLPPLLDPSPTSLKAIVGLVCLLGTIAAMFVLLRKSSPWALALGVFVIPLTPILLFPPWAQYLAGRYLFLSVGGLCIAIALAVVAVERRLGAARWVRYALFGVVAAAWAASSVAYNGTWANNLTLWSSVSERYPSFAHSHRMAGGGALEQEDDKAAYYWFSRCLEARPEDAECAARLAKLIAPTNPEAARSLVEGVLEGDYDGHAHRELARLMVNAGQSREALTLYEGWLQERPVSATLIAPAVDLALVAREPARALSHALQLLDAQALQHPSAPPPTATFLRVAGALGDVELSERVEEASRRCTRTDCFKQAMGR